MKRGLDDSSETKRPELVSDYPPDPMVHSALYICSALSLPEETRRSNQLTPLAVKLFLLNLRVPIDTQVIDGARCHHCNEHVASRTPISYRGLVYCSRPCLRAEITCATEICRLGLELVSPAPERLCVDNECFNCNRPLSSVPDVHYTPVAVSGADFTYGPWPHCRPECVMRTAYDTPCNSTEAIRLAYMRYGKSICPAPPRILLFLSSGVTLEQYHTLIDHKLVIHHESVDDIWSFPAPMYSSESFFGPYVPAVTPKDVSSVEYRFSSVVLTPDRHVPPALLAILNQSQHEQSPNEKDLLPSSDALTTIAPLSLSSQPVARSGLTMHPVSMMS
jgi:hypothetical protein